MTDKLTASDTAFADDLALMRAAAAKAAETALTFFRRPNAVNKKTDGSPVTEADLAVDAILIEMLRRPRPQYGWLSEESAEHNNRCDFSRVWVVDPIDGTRSFVRGSTDWTIGVALLEDGDVVLSTVINPVHGEAFEAVRGSGATLNGNPMRVSNTSELNGAKFARAGLGAPEVPYALRNGTDLVTVGSSLYRFALVACGRLDAALALSPKHEWDVAPGMLLVTEAGGRVSDRTGKTLRFNSPDAKVEGFVAANPILHQVILDQFI